MSRKKPNRTNKFPTKIFVVTNGAEHNVYLNGSAARGYKTMNNAYLNASDPNPYRILEFTLDEGVEII